MNFKITTTIMLPLLATHLDAIDNNRDKSIDKSEFFENLEGSCKI